MKRRMVAILMAFAMAGSIPAMAADVSSESEQTQSQKNYITSGSIYEAVKEVNENFEIYFDNDGYLTIEQNPDTIPENGAWKFIEDTIMVLQRSAISGKRKIKFIAGHDLKTQDVYEIFGIDDYSGPDNFGVIHASLTTNQALSSSYETAFQEYYGAHAVENKNNYYLHLLDPENNPAPDYYNNSYYWIVSCFGEKATGTLKPDESTIDVQIPDYEDSDVGGAASTLMAFNAMSRYGKIKAVTPEILPNDKVNISFTAEGDLSKVVFSVSSHWNGSSMYADSMSGSPNAMTGIKSAIDVIRKQGG
ncbi:hypothetical protein [Porcincola intestinalis]|uniref:Uncharacterized protein n=1 Tax=Porcincola intestinalis TaxID=2606632 RepID=A0A6L5X2G7_9FIRM|nr:hypothetical protein [Porcincola intestinalis]MSS13687.1 hypothetical protein [Porcincola intestinalis]